MGVFYNDGPRASPEIKDLSMRVLTWQTGRCRGTCCRS